MRKRMTELKRIMGFSTGETKPQAKIILRDFLAIDRTRLANQRTLLSFLRTGLYLFVTALAVIKMDFLSELQFLGSIFIALSILITTIGIINYVLMRKKIEKHYNDSPNHISDN